MKTFFSRSKPESTIIMYLHRFSFLSVDFFHIPVALSYPHFLYGADQYIHGVIGLNPDPEKHKPVIDLEPVSYG